DARDVVAVGPPERTPEQLRPDAVRAVLASDVQAQVRDVVVPVAVVPSQCDESGQAVPVVGEQQVARASTQAVRVGQLLQLAAQLQRVPLVAVQVAGLGLDQLVELLPVVTAEAVAADDDAHATSQYVPMGVLPRR